MVVWIVDEHNADNCAKVICHHFYFVGWPLRARIRQRGRVSSVVQSRGFEVSRFRVLPALLGNRGFS